MENKTRAVRIFLEPEIVMEKVCARCESIDIVDPDCICVSGDHETIEKEFEKCKCCGNINEIDHGK